MKQFAKILDHEGQQILVYRTVSSSGLESAEVLSYRGGIEIHLSFEFKDEKGQPSAAQLTQDLIDNAEENLPAILDCLRGAQEQMEATHVNPTGTDEL